MWGQGSDQVAPRADYVMVSYAGTACRVLLADSRGASSTLPRGPVITDTSSSVLMGTQHSALRRELWLPLWGVCSAASLSPCPTGHQDAGGPAAAAHLPGGPAPPGRLGAPLLPPLRLHPQHRQRRRLWRHVPEVLGGLSAPVWVSWGSDRGAQPATPPPAAVWSKRPPRRRRPTGVRARVLRPQGPRPSRRGPRSACSEGGPPPWAQRAASPCPDSVCLLTCWVCLSTG